MSTTQLPDPGIAPHAMDALAPGEIACLAMSHYWLGAGETCNHCRAAT
jgi:hypothetical protein